MALLSPAIEEFLDSERARGRTKGTVANKATVLRQFLGETGNIGVHKVSGAHIDRWLTAYSYKSPSTLNRDQDILRSLFKWCRSRKYVTPDFDPLEGLARRPVRKRNPVFVEADRFGEMLNSTKDPRDRMAIAMGMNTGLRLAEIASVEWGHVHIDDPDPERWHIQVWRKKKRASQDPYDEIPVFAELAEELRRWRLTYATMMGRQVQSHWRVVPAYHQGKFQKGAKNVMRPKRLNETRGFYYTAGVVHKILADLGYTQTRGEGSHTLRRSSARALYYEERKREGSDDAMDQVQSMLGHASRSTTEGYLRLDLVKERRNKRFAGRSMFPSLADQPKANVIDLDSVREAAGE